MLERIGALVALGLVVTAQTAVVESSDVFGHFVQAGSSLEGQIRKSLLHFAVDVLSLVAELLIDDVLQQGPHHTQYLVLVQQHFLHMRTCTFWSFSRSRLYRPFSTNPISSSTICLNTAWLMRFCGVCELSFCLSRWMAFFLSLCSSSTPSSSSRASKCSTLTLRKRRSSWRLREMSSSRSLSYWRTSSTYWSSFELRTSRLPSLSRAYSFLFIWCIL